LFVAIGYSRNEKKNVAVVIWETQHRHEQEPT